MNKTLSIETPGGTIEIQYKDAGEYFEFEKLALSTDSVEDCSGIWKEESVFNMENGWRLRVPTDILIGIINATRTLVNDRDTSRWSRDTELHKRLKGLVK